jgi:hypothetical protein
MSNLNEMREDRYSKLESEITRVSALMPGRHPFKTRARKHLARARAYLGESENATRFGAIRLLDRGIREVEQVIDLIGE